MPSDRITRLRDSLARPISPQSLAVIRILFGAILVWDCWRYIRHTRITRYYVNVDMTFPYFGWDFIQPLPEPWIHWAWLGVGVSAFLVMIGLFYRVAIVVFILLFGYFFLLDRSEYLNHNYMVLLYAALLAVAPAHRVWSVDARLWRGVAAPTIPRWPVAALRLQTEIILVYAGIVKITDDWLRAEPLRMWIHARMDDLWLAQIFQYDWMIMAAAIGTIVLHIVGAPLLLWRRSRIWVFAVYCCFHVSNSLFFNIGIFPWLTIAVTTIFFDPDWPGQLARRLRGGAGIVAPVVAAPATPLSRGLLVFLALWFAVQIVLPQRQLMFPNLVGWTGDGHRFSWRMRVYDRDAEGTFTVVSADGRQRWEVDLDDYLTRRQINVLLTRADMIHDFANRLGRFYAEAGHGDVAVHADVRMSLNGRPMAQFIDPTVDLTAVRYDLFAPDPWVMPLQHRAAEGIVPAWWPPLPLQKP